MALCIYFPLVISLSVGAHRFTWSSLRHSVTICGLASWSPQSHYPAKLASSQVWGFFPCVCALLLLCITSCNITFIAGCWNSELQSVTVQTLHNSKQVPQGVWVSSVLPHHCFLLHLATVQTFYVALGCPVSSLKVKCDESQDKSLKQKTFNLNLADEVFSKYFKPQ